jgi:hypothetical protein
MLQAACCFSMASINCRSSDGASCKANCSWSITVQQRDSWASCSAVRAAGGVRCRSCDITELLSSVFNLRASSSAFFMRRAGLMLAAGKSRPQGAAAAAVAVCRLARESPLRPIRVCDACDFPCSWSTHSLRRQLSTSKVVVRVPFPCRTHVGAKRQAYVSRNAEAASMLW